MSVISKARENPMITAVIVVLGAVSGANVGSVIQTFRYVDSLATKEDVTNVAAKISETAADNLADHIKNADDRMAGLEDKIDRVRAFTEVVPELRNLLTLRCMGTRGLDATIDRLKNEYRALTNETYIEPPCEQLLVVTR